MSTAKSGEVTYDLALLEKSAAKWRRSPGLRAVYGDILNEVAKALRPGRTLELGSGIGLAREFIPELTTSDIVKTPYVDRAVSAYALEEAGERWANIIAFDVLHHLRTPLRFLASASRALEPGGRVLLVEPAATFGGRLFYRLAHHEPCRPAEITAPFEAPDERGEFANMGTGWALFQTHRVEVEARLGRMGLRLDGVHYRDLLAYPATGGFSRPALLPVGVLHGLLRCERVMPQWLARRIGLRMVVGMTRI